MPRRNLIILGVAALIALIAVFLVNSWFSAVEQKQERVAQEQQLARIAVASQELAFGTPLTDSNVKLVNWPANSVPAGAFTSTSELVKDNRVALRPITIGEPVLASKVSGLNGRATLSANLPEDMRAVSIPISAVSSVSGFALPGDVVDILLTRQIPGDGASGSDKMTDVLMENVLLLAIDQGADESKTEPRVGGTATVQVDQYAAQKLVLAQQVGSLSLVLRNVQNQVVGPTQVVTVADLGGSNRFIPARPSAPAAPVMAGPVGPMPARYVGPPRPMGPTMTVFRGTTSAQYEVKRHAGW